jgi:hypothetical protein
MIINKILFNLNLNFLISKYYLIFNKKNFLIDWF